jgi:hypothetical protein
MANRGIDYHDYEKYMTYPLRRIGLWRDFATACNTILGRNIDEMRRRIGKLRESALNRKGDIISQILYLPDVNNPAIQVDTDLPPIDLNVGDIIPKAYITSVENICPGPTDPPSTDYFNLLFYSPSGNQCTWRMPINAVQEHQLIMNSLYLYGFNYLNNTFSDKDLQRLYENLNMLWWENGEDDIFIHFIGFVKNMELNLVPLWSIDDGTDYISVLEEFSSFTIPASQGGNYYLTSHVEIQYDITQQIYGINLDEIETLFYLLAPINLVMERITGVETVNLNIDIAIIAQASLIDYGVIHPARTVTLDIDVGCVASTTVYCYGSYSN